MAKRYNIFSLFLVLLFIVLMGSQSCLKSKRKGIPLEVVEVLNISGIHKPQLTRFILDCLQTSDSLKIDAGFFLLAKLQRNYTAYYKLVDTVGNSYNINPEDYKNLSEIRFFIDSIENNFGELSYVATSFAEDYSKVNSDFLMTNLTQAFDSWNNNPLGLNYDFETFKRFILPFKVGNEDIEPFRDYLRNRFIDVIDTGKSFTENINKLNREINSLVIYDERYIRNLQVQPIRELLSNGKGNLADINILKVKIFRSLGIAAVMDYTPFIADSTGWYAWTTVISPKGEEIHFDISNGVLEQLLDNKIAKIYRRTYFEDTSSLFALKDMKESTPRFLGHFNYFDVSGNYFTTLDTSITINTKSKYTYLAVFNNGKWRPIDWALNVNGKSHFTRLKGGITYQAVDWKKKKTIKYGDAFVLGENE